MTQIKDKIKSRGYWRILYRPIIYKERIPELKDCRKIIEKNAVLLRGWDFPHLPQRTKDYANILPGDNYYEAWIDWSVHKELWRFYQSGQFVTYRGFWEDWEDENFFQSNIGNSSARKLGVLHTVYQVTEIFEFFSGLAREGIYKEGVQLILELVNINERELWLEDALRAPFMWPRKTGALSIEYNNEYSDQELITNSTDLATEAILHIFKRFEWEPARELVRNDQDELLKRRRTRT